MTEKQISNKKRLVVWAHKHLQRRALPTVSFKSKHLFLNTRPDKHFQLFRSYHITQDNVKEKPTQSKINRTCTSTLWSKLRFSAPNLCKYERTKRRSTSSRYRRRDSSTHLRTSYANEKLKELSTSEQNFLSSYGQQKNFTLILEAVKSSESFNRNHKASVGLPKSASHTRRLAEWKMTWMPTPCPSAIALVLKIEWLTTS